jgi:general secretion pathway protein G
MQRMIKRAREEGGFTLIELMIVIVILGVLAGIVLFAVGGITDRGTSAACKTDVSTIQTGVEAYFAKEGKYPPDLVPSLTDPAGSDQFLKWDSSFTDTVSASDAGTGGMVRDGQGYTIEYQGPATGDVWVAPAGGTPAADTSCP